MNAIGVEVLELNAAADFSFLKNELLEMRVVTNGAKAVARLPRGHVPTAEEISLLVRVEVESAEWEGLW